MRDTVILFAFIGGIAWVANLFTGGVDPSVGAGQSLLYALFSFAISFWLYRGKIRKAAKRTLRDWETMAHQQYDSPSITETGKERLQRVRLHSRASLKAMLDSEYRDWKEKLSTKSPKDHLRLLQGFREAAAHSTISSMELRFLESLFKSDGGWKDGVTDEDILIVLSYTQIMTGNVDVRIPRDYLQYLEPEDRVLIPQHWIR